jgi:hypothetical protein
MFAESTRGTRIMTVQFRLGHNHHKVVEDFLSRSPAATSAITLDAKAARHQVHAAAVAREHGISVFYESSTERLADPGYHQDAFPAWSGVAYAVDVLAAGLLAREALVQRTLEAHPDGVTHVTAPHFYVDSERTARLNIDLAEMTRIRVDDKPTRAVLTVANRFAKQHAAEMAADYVRAGITEIELRMSPFGGEDEGLKKIRDGFAAAQAFTDAGLNVTLGQSGNLGQVAVALGHVASYSVGIGLLEHVNHSAQINRQKQAPKPRSEDDTGGGPVTGVFLNGLALTARPRVAEAMLGHSDLRTRVGCREGRCGTSVRGPLLDSRDHYLHSRDIQMRRLLDQPEGWRPTSEIDRLRSALNLREHINANYLGPDRLALRPLPTRTLNSLISDIEHERKAS